MTDLDEFYYVPRHPVGPQKDPKKRTQRDVLEAYEKFRLDRCPDLPEVRLPDRPVAIHASSSRHSELQRQLRKSGAKVVITLGSEPIPFVAPAVPLENNVERYGQAVPVQLWGMGVLLLRLCHPRQAGGLGAHSESWTKLHAGWATRVAEVGGLSALVRLAHS